MTVTVRTSRAKALIVPLLLCFALSLIAVGCVTLTGHDESCSRTKLFGSISKMTCSGTIETVRGEGPLTFGNSYSDDDEDEYSGEYRLEMTASVEQGRMDIYAEGANGGRKGGEVSPGNPLKIEAVGPFEGSVAVKVKGGEDAAVKGLKYEVTIAQVN
jgi:hypothetical protein